MGAIREELEATYQMEWVMRVFYQHRFTMGAIGIMAYLNIRIGRLEMIVALYAGTAAK